MGEMSKLRVYYRWPREIRALRHWLWWGYGGYSHELHRKVWEVRLLGLSVANHEKGYGRHG